MARDPDTIQREIESARDSLAESLDLKQAMRAYEANLNVLENQDAMDASTLSILKK